MRLLNEIRNYMGNYHVKSGVYHFYRNEFTQAIAFLRKALADESSLTAGDRANARSYLTQAHRGQALKLAANGEVASGLDELHRAVELRPDYPDLHHLAAGFLERLGRGAEAVAAYRRAIECHEGYLEARVDLAYCLVREGRIEEAATTFREALELKLERVRAPFEEGLAALASGDVESALPRMHDVFLAAPRLSGEYLNKAVEWVRAEEYERALGDLELALELNPSYPDLHNLRGVVLCELDRVDEAIPAFERSAELGRGHLVPRLNLAFARLRAGRVEAAEDELKSILERHPQEPVATAKLEELASSAQRPGEKRGLGSRA